MASALCSDPPSELSLYLTGCKIRNRDAVVHNPCFVSSIDDSIIHPSYFCISITEPY